MNCLIEERANYGQLFAQIKTPVGAKKNRSGDDLALAQIAQHPIQFVSILRFSTII